MFNTEPWEAVTLAGNVSRKYPAKLPRHSEITGNYRKEWSNVTAREMAKREDTLNDGVVEGSIIKERQDKSKNQKKDKRYRLD